MIDISQKLINVFNLALDATEPENLIEIRPHKFFQHPALTTTKQQTQPIA